MRGTTGLLTINALEKLAYSASISNMHKSVFETYCYIITLMLINFLCWNVRGIMSTAYSLFDMFD